MSWANPYLIVCALHLIVVEQELNTYRLSLFGGWSLHVDEQPVDIQGLRERALISILLLDSPAIVLRKDIADLLWPGSDPSKARASLRQSISVLKKAFSKHGIETKFLESMALGGDFCRVQTEVDELDTAIYVEQSFKRIMGVIAGENDILSSLSNLSSRFEDWLVRTRAIISTDIKSKLLEVSGNPTLSPQNRVLAADAVLRLNEYDEGAVRSKMSSYAALAENGTALKIYGDFVELLDEELGAEPSLKTQDLAVKIKLAADDAASEHYEPKVFVQPVPTAPVSLAVLPFTALGVDPISKYEVLGILDQLTCWLAMNKAPAVISSNSTRKYLNQDVPLQQVRADLGASYVLTGSARSAGENVAFAVQLCDTRTEHVVWSMVQNCKRQDVININTDIAQRISYALSPSVNAAELSRTWHFDDTDLEPYHLLLRAKDRMFKLTFDGFTEAGHLLHQALQKRPDYAPAHALLADWHSIRYWQKWSQSPERDFDQMNDHVQRAMSLAPSDGRIMAMWGHFKIILERNYDAAIELFDEAVSLNPNDSETLNWSVPTLAYSGYADKAVKNAKLAMRLSPYDPFLFRNEHFLSIAYYADGDFDRAAQYGLSSFKRVPAYTSNIRTTIASMVAAGRKAEITDLLDAHVIAEPNFSTAGFLPNQGFRLETDKELYGNRLLQAGLAP